MSGSPRPVRAPGTRQMRRKTTPPSVSISSSILGTRTRFDSRSRARNPPTERTGQRRDSSPGALFDPNARSSSVSCSSCDLSHDLFDKVLDGQQARRHRHIHRSPGPYGSVRSASFCSRSTGSGHRRRGENQRSGRNIRCSVRTLSLATVEPVCCSAISFKCTRPKGLSSVPSEYTGKRGYCRCRGKPRPDLVLGDRVQVHAPQSRLLGISDIDDSSAASGSTDPCFDALSSGNRVDRPHARSLADNRPWKSTAKGHGSGSSGTAQPFCGRGSCEIGCALCACI